MKPTTVLCLAAAGFLSAAGAARADLMTSWSYQFSSTPTITIGNAKQSSTISLPGTSLTSMSTAPYTPSSIDTQLTTTSNAPATDPLRVSNLPFRLDLKITDDSGKSHDFVFSGVLNGNLWKGGSTLSPTFFTSLDQSQHFGNFTYQAEFVGFTPTSGSGQYGGTFEFQVIHHNPEPSSLVLAGIGVPLLGLRLRRRQRKSLIG